MIDGEHVLYWFYLLADVAAAVLLEASKFRWQYISSPRKESANKRYKNKNMTEIFWTEWKNLCITSEPESTGENTIHDKYDDINNEGMLLIYIETCY